MIKKNALLELEITDLAFGGKGIAKVENFVIFVDGALPGQKVEVRIAQKKRRHAEAKILKILDRSSLEIENEYLDIPGAPWARLPINTQQKFKQKQVFQLFKNFAQKDLTPVFDEFITSPKVWNYRNKMEFSFGFSDEQCEILTPHSTEEETPAGRQKIWHHHGFALGSKKRGQFWLVENLNEPSGLFDADFEAFLPEIKRFCESTGLSPYNPRKNEGFFRHLVVRKSFFENKLLINLVTTTPPFEEAEVMLNDFTNLLTNQFGNRIAGIFHTLNNAVSDGGQTYEDRKLLYGKATIIEKINDLEFEISLDSFFQTNVHSAELLYNKVVQYVGSGEDVSGNVSPKKNILDLFCGTGTIGQILAKNFPQAHITGVEIVPSAISDAQKNAQRNGLHNVEFVCADVKIFCRAQSITKEATIVLDPPRAGIAPKVLQKICEAKPSKIIYVSCNPATMARDTAQLSEGGYELRNFSLIDQFPHTSHIECVGVFSCLQEK